MGAEAAVGCLEHGGEQRGGVGSEQRAEGGDLGIEGYGEFGLHSVMFARIGVALGEPSAAFITSSVVDTARAGCVPLQRACELFHNRSAGDRQ